MAGVDRPDESPNYLCAIQIVVTDDCRGIGLSHRMVTEMKKIGQSLGLKEMVAPVRPSAKDRHPLLPVEEYVLRRTAEGLPEDSWIRVHAWQGARIVKVCPRAMEIYGSVADWQEWTGRTFEAGSPHVIEGALNPVEFDLEADRGV